MEKLQSQDDRQPVPHENELPAVVTSPEGELDNAQSRVAPPPYQPASSSPNRSSWMKGPEDDPPPDPPPDGKSGNPQ